MVSQPAEAALRARIARARALAAEHPAAAELLIFYAELAEFQRSTLEPSPVGQPSSLPAFQPSFRDALDLEPALHELPAFLEWISVKAPSLKVEPRQDWPAVIAAYVADGAPGLQAQGHSGEVVFVAAALIQPLAEQLAISWRAAHPATADLSGECPVCGAPPVVGVLRPEGQGARRALVCSFCLTEHDYLRVVCTACGERQFDALPIYTAEQCPHVRIDACDGCRTYLKTIDLTKDGLAVPVVDDVASASLDLWARERGYERQQRNLLAL